MNEPGLQEIKPFRDGMEGMAGALNKIVEPVNALIRKAGPKGAGGDAKPSINAYWTVVNDDGSVQLMLVSAPGVVVVSEVTTVE